MEPQDDPDPDRTLNEDLWRIEAREGATPLRLTETLESESGRPVWSPDGTRIAVLVGDVDKYSAYDQNKLATVHLDGASASTAPPDILTRGLDRAVSMPTWSADGRTIAFLLQDDRTQHLARVSLESPTDVRRVTSGRRSVRALSAGKDGAFAVLATSATEPAEISMYGLDQYIVQYDQEMDTPWTAQDTWMKVSYPFFHADRIKTPTLFLCGEKDFNVPVAGVEQMYQALSSNGVPSQLVIYPGQFHGLVVPSYERDRLQRYLDWFNKYLQPANSQSAARDR